MPFPLRPQEMPFYPQPFVETEVHLLVITNQRVVQFGDDGRQEIEARDVNFVGRVSERPWLIAGAVVALIGIPLLIVGAYLFLTAKGLPAMPAIPGVPAAAQAPAAPPSVNDDPAGPASDDPAAPAPSAPAGPTDPKTQMAEGLVLALLGFILGAGGGLAATRQRHVVLVRGSRAVIKINAKTQMEQAQILSTLQAVQQAGKAAPATAAAAPAKPKVQVDDKGDPVKALQDLAAQRAAGKVSEDDFLAKREILLERVRNRK
jgi:hypothetical protein